MNKYRVKVEVYVELETDETDWILVYEQGVSKFLDQVEIPAGMTVQADMESAVRFFLRRDEIVRKVA